MPTQPARRASLGALLLGLCVAYLMLRPVSNSEILYPTLGLIGLISAGVFASQGGRLARELLPVLILATTTGLLGLVVGVGNPGWINGVLTWGIAPAIFWCWAAAMNMDLLRTMLKAMAWATILLSVFILLYVGAEAGLLPQIIPPALLEETGAGFDGTGEATAIRLYGLSTLAAAAPMWVAALFVKKHPALPAKWVQIIAAVTATAAAYVGGRRAIVVVVILTPLIVLALRLLVSRKRTESVQIPIWAAILGVMAVPVAIFAIPPVIRAAPVQQALLAVASLFTSTADSDGGGVRIEQTRALMDGFADRPIVGNGFGAVLESGYYRSAERPWNFEMQYPLVAFQTGVVGIIFMGLAVVFALVALRKAALNHREALPVLMVAGTSAIAMLIANFTNPYLQAPGHMWAVFIALGAINAVLNLPPREPDNPEVVPTKQRHRQIA